MGRKKKHGVFLELPEGIASALEKVSEYKGLPIEDYLRVLVIQAAPDILTSREKRPAGRPPAPTPPLLPDDVERGATASGFVGVYKYGRNWKAFWDKSEGELGLFELPEHAAFARYWYNKGRLSVTISALREAGASEEDLAATARQLGIDLVKMPVTTSKFQVGDKVDYDPVLGPGPIQRGLTIVEGPIIDADESILWRLDGVATPVREEDLDHALEG